MAIRFPAMRSIAPAVRLVLRPWRGAATSRLAGGRIATPACALVRNDILGSAVRVVEVPGFREAGVGGTGNRPTVRVSTVHPAPAIHP